MVAKVNRFWALVVRSEEMLKRTLGIKSGKQQIPFPQATGSWLSCVEDFRSAPTDRTATDPYDPKRILARLAREHGAVAESDEMEWDVEDDGYEQDRLAFEAALTQPIKPSIPVPFVP